MKKIYLLLLLCCLSLQGFSTTWYGCSSGDVKDTINWRDRPTCGGSHPNTFITPGDTWIILSPMLDSGGTWNVGGNVIFQFFNIKHVFSTVTDTIRIAGDVTMDASATQIGIRSDSGVGNLELYIGGNLTMAGTTSSFTTSTAGLPIYNHIHFNGGRPVGNPQLYSNTSSAPDTYTSYFVDSGDLKINTSLKVPGTADSGFIVYGNGALICPDLNQVMGGGGNFKLYSNGSIYIGHYDGISDAFVGSVVGWGSPYFDRGAHYVYNSASFPQAVGGFLPDSLVAPGTDTIDNPRGVTLSTHNLTCDSGTATCLKRGVFKISGDFLGSFQLNMLGGSKVYVDSGNFDTNPHYFPFVDVIYRNLGANALAWTTGYELIPVGLGFSGNIGNVIINKPGAVITLGSPSAVNDSVIIDTGTLANASIPFGYTIGIIKAWINNSGTSAFIPHTSLVGMYTPPSGSGMGYIGGAFATTFYNLGILNSFGVLLGADETVDSLLSVYANLTIYNHNLSLGPLAPPVAPGFFSNTNMIVADSTGEVRKLFNADGTYFFPIGDRGPDYTPIGLTFTGDSYAIDTSFGGVNVTPKKEPHNANITDYLNRYWSVDATTINLGNPTYTDSATYVPADVVGSGLSAAVYEGTLPWIKFGPAVGTTITSGIITGGNTNFTGISTQDPTLTSSPDTLICAGNMDTLTATATRDTPFTYTWMPPDGLNVTTGAVVVASPTVTTTYTVTLTDGNGFTTTATTTVSVNPIPALLGIPPAYTNAPICEGDTLFLYGSIPSNVLTYSWSGPGTLSGAATDTAFIAAATPAASGIYTVTVANGTGIGCSATYTVSATVNPAAGADSAIGGGTFCGGSLISAVGGIGGTIWYQFSTSNGTDNTDRDSTTFPVLVTTTGTYYFRAQTALGCWGKQDSVHVVINPIPSDLTVSPSSSATDPIVGCDSATITATGGSDGTIYFQGTTAGGTDTTDTVTTRNITTLGTNTYYFRLRSPLGCWSFDGIISDSAVVTINRHAGPVKDSGTGTFCDSARIFGNYTDTIAATVWYQGTTRGGTDTTMGNSPQTVTSSGTYYFRARSNTGSCWGPEDSVAIVINPLPASVTVTGITPSCDSTLLTADNGGIGTIYYEGSNDTGTSIALPITSREIYTSGTYYFRAQSSFGCWSDQTNNITDSAVIVINDHAATVTASGGGGPFCGSTVITGNVTTGDSVYFQGTTSLGTFTSLGDGIQTVTASGTYYFRAQTAAGCWGTQDSVTVLINPLPLPFSVTGGGSFCTGGTGFHVGLGGSQLGIKYQLYTDSIATNPPVNGTGSLLDFGLFTNPGTYTVVATDTTTGCTLPMNGDAIIVVNPLPVVHTVSPPAGSYCLGGTGIDLSLDGAEPDVNYYVYNGSTLINIVPGAAAFGSFDLGMYTGVGTYTVTAINDTTGCTSHMLDSTVISTIPLPTVYMVTGGGVNCFGDTGFHVILTGTDTGTSYQLYNGLTAIGLPAIGDGTPVDYGLLSVPGTYTVIATNPLTGCTNSMGDSAVIVTNPLPLQFNLSGGGSFCAGGSGAPIALDGSEFGVNYKVFDNGTLVETVPGTGGTPPFDLGFMTLAGAYTVIGVNASTGCTDSMFSTTGVSINGLPTVYTMFGGGSYCAGGVGYDVGISGSQTGIAYTLFKDGSAIDSLHGTGAILFFGYKTAGGTYNIVATDTATGCTSNMAGITTIIVNPLPIIYHVTGGGSYCAGGIGSHINLSGSNLGIAYQVYMGGLTVAGTVPGTGSAMDLGLFLPIGTYTVTALNVATGCTDTMRDSATISVNPLPGVYTVTGGGSYCVTGAGVHVGLSGSATGIAYQLYKGVIAIGGPVAGTGTSIDFGLETGAGSYTVVAIDTSTGCSVNMTGSKTVSVNPLPAVHLVSGGGVLCVGDAGVHIGVTASETGIAYQLYNGPTPSGDPLYGNGSALDFGLQTVGGTYTVVAVDTATGCQSTMSGSATVTVNSPVIPEVTLDAHPSLRISVGSLDTLVAIVTGAGSVPATYQWFINGNLVPGATSDTFSFQVYFNTDSITCEVTSHGTCGGHTTSKSAFISLFNVGVNQVAAAGSNLRLMPNPNKGVFTLKGTLGTTDDQEVSVEITDMLGQVIYKDQVMAKGGNIDQRIQLSNQVANGMYLLNLRSGTQNNVFHFVIEQ